MLPEKVNNKQIHKSKITIMKTKSILGIALLGLAVVSFSSCKKCGECHYDAADGSEVEIGEYCGDDLEAIESSGYVVNGETFTVHCGEH